jgi:tRNA(adenine34) deaminase
MSKDCTSEFEYARLMDAAVEQALLAQDEGDVPIGAVIANADGEIIASAYNRRIIDADPTAHAEVLAIRAAANAIGDWRLNGCTLAVTLEPCCMCAGAIVLARIDRVVYGATDPKAGAVNTLYEICSDPRLNHRCEIIPGVNADKCGQLLTDFFRIQRAAGKK